MFRGSLLIKINKNILSDEIVKKLFYTSSLNIKQFNINIKIRKNSTYTKMDFKRYWEDTELGGKFRKQSNNVPGIPFIIASYNILAQSALETHDHLYNGIEKKHLDWSYRVDRIAEEINNLKPHILCLQEVQSNHLNDIKSRLTNLNFTTTYYRRSGEKVDGCAILYNDDIFNRIEEKRVNLYREGIKILDRDNVAILLKLSMKTNPEAEFIIGNTHLLYNPNREDVRLAQTQLILAEMEIFSKKHDGSHIPIILVGDFNFTQHSNIYKLITTGILDGVENSLSESLKISKNCQYEYNKKSNYSQQNYYKKQPMNLTHNLNFISILRPNNLVKTATTLHKSWIIVDHIFYTTLSNGEESKLKLLSRMLPPSIDQCIKTGIIPNKIFGSDHYVMAANFLIQ